jgi:hypothetical protein
MAFWMLAVWATVWEPQSLPATFRLVAFLLVCNISGFPEKTAPIMKKVVIQPALDVRVITDSNVCSHLHRL